MTGLDGMESVIPVTNTFRYKFQIILLYLANRSRGRHGGRPSGTALTKMRCGWGIRRARLCAGHSERKGEKDGECFVPISFREWYNIECHSLGKRVKVDIKGISLPTCMFTSWQPTLKN